MTPRIFLFMNYTNNIKNKTILDYGCGPGILASALRKGGGSTWAYDISPEMRNLTALKIGNENVHSTVFDIHNSFYDVIICNLVMCIVDENEVLHISRNIQAALKDSSSRAFIGFCNPHLLTISETQLDLRPEPTCNYNQNHSYLKTKKEGCYQIIENHRPVEWYEKVFVKANLHVVKRHFTPKYELKGNEIQDFIIFELARGA